MFTKKPGPVIGIDVGYWLVAAVIMFIAQGIF